MHFKLGDLEIKMVENRLLEPKSSLNQTSDVIFHRGIEIGIEYFGNSLVLVPTTEILVP